MELEVPYRCNPPAIAPRPIKLQIPGWAGDSHGKSDGDKPQPWHCVPFVEANTYGLEFVYPHEQEARLSRINGKTVIEPEGMFKQFADGHVGFQGHLDILVPDEWTLRLEPHPRYFTDETGTVPLIVPGHLQTQWWARYFFIVFKVPFEGQTHIFRYGEPYAQALIVPKKMVYKLREMTPEEKHIRQRMSDASMYYDALIGDHDFLASNGINFNDKYRTLATAYAKDGHAGVEKIYERAKQRAQKITARKPNNKIPRKMVKKGASREQLAEQHLLADGQLQGESLQAVPTGD